MKKNKTQNDKKTKNDKLKYLNIGKIRNDKTLPAAESLPTLIPKRAYEAIIENEADPYMLVEAINFPTKGDGGIYTRTFFESFVNKMKEYPFGGSKTGHYNNNNDFFTVGGKIELDNEKEGTAYFKILVPKMDSNGNPTGNAAFIRDCKAGYVNFSLCAYPTTEYIKNAEGLTIPYIVGTEGGERNDSVGYDNGFMPQVVNDNLKESDLMEMVNEGKYFTEKTDSEDIIQNGKISRYALIKKLNAGVLDQAKKNVLSAIDKAKKITKRGNNKMDKTELLNALKAAISNNQLTLEEIAKETGLSDKVKTNEDGEREKLLKAIKEALGLDEAIKADEVLEKVKEILKEVEAAEETVAENAAIDLAGAKTVKNSSGIDEANPCFIYAKNALIGKHGKELETAKNALKTDPVLLALRSKQADGMTDKKINEKKSIFLEV
ncbi:MAG: hypothetical protein LBQ37_02500 [Elusimicrobiota bacterium]|jgi:hypothetical protein|nr:hypothetical protein [Elusimicrobiota bacterium]